MDVNDRISLDVDQVTTRTFIALATMLAVRGAPPVIGIAFLIIVIHGMVDEKFRVSWPALVAFAARPPTLATSTPRISAAMARCRGN